MKLALETMSKSQLIHLIISYNNYIKEHGQEDFDAGWTQVCLEEFYDNDYMLNEK